MRRTTRLPAGYGWHKGNGFGFLATPRVGQEVIISYLNGDIDRPIITDAPITHLTVRR
ncbi:phage baseplate assembly protein V [Photorhabdus sp. RM323S]|uniref:phage baseplate assembly protein V n=1 Tax=Photorhabdus sp. RM323S TaxID=3342828 RepID=UPI0036DDDEC8